MIDALRGRRRSASLRCSVLRLRPPGQEGRPREPITARLMGDLFVAAGADRIVRSICTPARSRASSNAVRLTHRAAGLRRLPPETPRGPTHHGLPGLGPGEDGSRYARHLDRQVAFVHKRRRPTNATWRRLEIVGEVEGRHCVIVDDMIDTAGTVVSPPSCSRARGARVGRGDARRLSPPAVDRLKNAPIDEVVITNTLPVPDDAQHLDKLTVLVDRRHPGRRHQRHLRRRLGERHLQGREPVTPRRRVLPTSMP